MKPTLFVKDELVSGTDLALQRGSESELRSTQYVEGPVWCVFQLVNECYYNLYKAHIQMEISAKYEPVKVFGKVILRSS